MEHDHGVMATEGFFENLFQVYVPRQQCMFYEANLIWLHIISDLIIAFSYYSIPLALVYFAKRRKDLAYNWMFLLFALFIILCGTTHVFSIIAIWHPLYRVDGLVKLLTGIASIATTILLWRLMPHALALPSQAAIIRRKDELELLVQQRTAELTESQEKLRAAAERAETANQTKSDFLANMSHELRTPMNAVVGLSSLLAMSKDLSPRQQEFVATLQLSAQSLMGLINDLLDITKIETNKIELEHIPFTFGDILKDVFGMLSPKASEKHILLHYVTSPLNEQVFLGDPTRIRQIITNLVSNAIKFTEAGGVTVSLEASPGAKPNHFEVRLAVADTGIGIADHKLDAIFEKFIQADTSTTRKYGGSGLGLAISLNLAKIMGGRLSVASSPGKGSEFVLHLPLQKAPDGEAKPVAPKAMPSEKTTGTQRARLLLVEDYQPNILVATSLLEDMGYEVIAAHNGQEALSLLRADRSAYAAVLMDVQMPGLDGFEATQLIRQEEREKGLPHLPIIAMTAYTLQGDKERCLAVGMDGYIPKPFQPEELKQVLERIL